MSMRTETRETRASFWRSRGALASAGRAAIVRPFLARLHSGRLVVELPSGERIEHKAAEAGVEARVTIHRWRALRRLVAAGDVGFARAYIDGDWSSPDLTALIELAARNGASFLDRMEGNPIFRMVNALAHAARRNTRAGSRRNIEFHYDLGNEFYRAWLDPSMLYSSAIYASPDQSLEEAQVEKLRRIRAMLDPAENARVLEIGCGWGALAAHLAREAGARVDGITLSPSQLAFARDMIAREGLAGRVDLRLEDYRDTRGAYDRIVSIEMIEAVGESYWPSYFGALRDRLKPGGRAVIQAITIAEERFETYRARPDFIQRYIFPGGFLPTKSAIRDAAARAGLRVVAVDLFGDSYARTLAEWRRRFLAAWPRIEAMGFDASFRRMWEYYLCYCEAGFRTGVIDVGLHALERVDA